MKEIQMKEMKYMLVEMMREIHEFCIANDIKYSLAYGTALGAIRHNDFIPWDDDIDIMMPREDYNKFINLFKSDKLKIMTHNNENYAYAFGKVINTETLLIENKVKSKYKLGLYIDIFPLDYIQEDKLPQMLKKIEWLKFLICFSVIKLSGGKSFIRSILKNVTIIFVNIYLFIIHLNTNRLIQNLENYILEKEPVNKKFLYNLVGGSKNDYFMTKYDFVDCIDIPFHNYKFKVIKDYDKYLKKIYGDYMILPPEKERVSNHQYSLYKLQD